MNALLLVLFLASTTVKDQIVVTASALPESVESTPAAVTVITKDGFHGDNSRMFSAHARGVLTAC